MASNSDQQAPHVAIITFPMASHTGSLFGLARALATAAPYAIFSFICYPDHLGSFSSGFTPIANLRLCHEVLPEFSGGSTPDEQLHAFLGAMPENLRAGIEAAVTGVGGLRVSCILGDGLLPVLGEMAKEMGVPWIAQRFTGPSMVAAHLYANEIRQFFGVQQETDTDDSLDCEGTSEYRADEPISFIPCLSKMRVRDLPDFILSENYSAYSTVTAEIIHHYPLATAVVFNTFQGLEPSIDADFTTKFNKYLPIGPVSLITPLPLPPPSDQCMPWLDCHITPASVVYVNFGTHNTPRKAELAELAEGLEASGVPFLWSLKDNAREGLPLGFVERVKGRGMMVSWAPQQLVLEHSAVGALVTHCGWNSVMEGISGGVAMVCRPFMWDQATNARVVSHVLGIGLEVGRAITREGIARALNVVMKEEEGKWMRERVGVLKESAERAVSIGGSSSENFKHLVDIVCGRC